MPTFSCTARCVVHDSIVSDDEDEDEDKDDVDDNDDDGLVTEKNIFPSIGTDPRAPRGHPRSHHRTFSPF